MRSLIPNRVPVLIASIVFAVSSANGQNYEIDFNFDQNGAALISGSSVPSAQPYGNLFGGGEGVRVSTDSPGVRPLNYYNTEGSTGEDPDLERNSEGTGLWEGGNLLGGNFGNVLIVNKNDTLTTPNDNGGGGKIILEFDRELVAFGFDFVDMDQASSASVIFGSGPGAVEVEFAAFESGSGSIHSVSGVSFGDRHANRILDIRADELGLSSFSRVEFDLASSGGIGTVYVETIPEPASFYFGVLGLAALCLRRRR
ncbi:PEP-CTERM sorting domain-containing protein [Haloferula rosea]|uniref:PEP-CTERM protein-sorting domain-containing protein n=1 Tax=Haloferula rosea TaxID=490093 RepID=A0A934RD58_9BACT|nr:PEP-CTERM sorting domain-containing protein [Haloferula rosea]MBK1829012.1 hypothetical protein [Haloferula rosea]